jgi:hypothetical protein
VSQAGLRVRPEGRPEETRQAPPLIPPGDDFLRDFAAVVRGEIRPSGRSSLEYKLVVAEILDAAHRPAEAGRRVSLG